MYTIEETDIEVIVHGPDGYERRLSKSAIGIVLREDIEQLWLGALRPYTIQVGSMTRSEAAACALGILAYPANWTDDAEE